MGQELGEVPAGMSVDWYIGYIKGMADAMRLARNGQSPIAFPMPPYYPNPKPVVTHNVYAGNPSSVEDWHGKSEQSR